VICLSGKKKGDALQLRTWHPNSLFDEQVCPLNHCYLVLNSIKSNVYSVCIAYF
jgi:hypothetical protein